MSVTTVSIDRTSLSLPALVISDDGATYQLTEKGLGRPAITWRNTYLPDNPNIHGSQLIAASKETSSLPLEVLVQATTSAALDTAISDLTAALDQFAYTTTVVVDGVSKTWSCDPASYGSTDGLVDHSRVEQFFEVLAIAIPVYPIPGA